MSGLGTAQNINTHHSEIFSAFLWSYRASDSNLLVAVAHCKLNVSCTLAPASAFPSEARGMHAVLVSFSFVLFGLYFGLGRLLFAGSSAATSQSVQRQHIRASKRLPRSRVHPTAFPTIL